MAASPKIFGGRYALLQAEDEPRRGGMASVYHCADLANAGRHVAVKLIKPPRALDHLEELIYERELNVRDLTHPNIVEFLDMGREDDGTRYLVYEWVPHDLKSWMPRHLDLGTDDFVEQIALPIIRALALAHERQIVHRDVKPRNVLMSEQGTPKLADFGISKVRYQLEAGSPTLIGAYSKPFTPPTDDSESGERRDVFGFGALLLWGLSLPSLDLREYSDFGPAVDALDATPELIDLIVRCTSFDQADRPGNAVQVMAELEGLQSKRRQNWARRQVIFLQPKQRVVANLAAAINVPESEVAAFIEGELADGPAVRVLEMDGNTGRYPGERHAFAYGDKWSFRLSFPPGSPVVEVIGGRRIDEAECDSRRDRHLVAENWDFKVSKPLDHASAVFAAEELLDAIEVFESDRSASKEAREEQRLFDQWRRQLDAREAAEVGREDRVAYVALELSGQRAKFTVKEHAEGFAVEQRRSVLSGEGRRVAFGEVEAVSGKQVDVYLDHEPRSPIPGTGSLAIDTVAAMEVIRRERRSLNALRFAGPELRRTDLPHLILHPSEVSALEATGDLDWAATKLDESKREAVRGAMGSRDFFVVQGPPGTGKTTFIAELVCQELHRHPGARILLASQSNVALDNALERIRDLAREDVKLLRLGNAAEGKISDSVKGLTLDERLDRWRAEVRRRSEAHLEAHARLDGGDLELLRASAQLNELASVLDESDDVRERIDRLERRISEGVAGGGQHMTSEELQLAQSDLTKERRRRAQLDREARRLRELKPAATHLKGLASHDRSVVRPLADGLLARAKTSEEFSRLVELQAKWLERLGRGPEFQAAMLASSQVVAGTCVGMARAGGIHEVPFDLCIVDEASRAAATETLIPMVRANRWVLVGDEKQLPPFLDEALRDPAVVEEFQLDVAESERTLFSRLIAELPREKVAGLNTQYRMVPAIGDLISECFYRGELASYDTKAPWDLGFLQPAPVTWMSTEATKGRSEQRRGTEAPSYVNSIEARAVIQHLERLDLLLSTRTSGDAPIKVLILAPYRLQVEQIARGVDVMQRTCERLQVEVGTVDAVQGREADILFFSAVRSNSEGSMGFVRDLARANVALSRGRYSLTIFGDAEFFDRVPGPLGDVLSYIRRHPQSCHLKVLGL